MRTIVDSSHVLQQGLQDIRQQYQVANSFPDDVLAAAKIAANLIPNAHIDRTDMPFVTLDPATSVDLDQAFSIERSGNDLLLHYAIADVAWFVSDGDALDIEAWRRGTTQYLPDGKAGLYPPSLSEAAASLLPDGPRAAVVFTVRVDPLGAVKLDRAERAIIRSRAKLGYDSVDDSQLPPEFAELSQRIQTAEQARGATRLDSPDQEVVQRDGGFELTINPPLLSETRNAAMSLATNLAIADVLHANGTGLFRIMAGPDDAAINRLRATAIAFDLVWPAEQSLGEYQKTLQASDPKQAALMLAIRRAGARALYAPYHAGVVPWHAAMAATYSHATAPLRRLADRYVVQATLAIMNGRDVPDAVTQAFKKLPKIMAKADGLGGQIERAVIDLAEAAILQNKLGEIFAAVVTDKDERGARVQLHDYAVVTRIEAHGVSPGDRIRVQLTGVDMHKRKADFKRVG
jgi:VacB/RNase II family 3'-5' exoribonuclease